MPSVTRAAMSPTRHAQGYPTVTTRQGLQLPTAVQPQQTGRDVTTSSYVPCLPELHHPSNTAHFLHSILLQNEEEMTDRGSEIKMKQRGSNMICVHNKSKGNSHVGPTSCWKKLRPHLPSNQAVDSEVQQHTGPLGLSSKSLPDIGTDLIVSKSTTVRTDSSGQPLKTQTLSAETVSEMKNSLNLYPCHVTHDGDPGTMDGNPGTMDGGLETMDGDPGTMGVDPGTMDGDPCRAIQEPSDELLGSDSDEQNDDEEDSARRFPSVKSEQRSPDVHSVSETSSPSTETHSLSSITSSLSWRKRPLLLPPIMLPPIYTVKPAPLILRDEVYFAGAGAHVRGPISDKEWEELKGCRYLRIRPIKQSVKL